MAISKKEKDLQNLEIVTFIGMIIPLVAALAIGGAVYASPEPVDENTVIAFLGGGSALLALSYGFGIYGDRSLDKIQGRA